MSGYPYHAVLLDLIDPRIRNRVDELQKQFRSAEPFPHIILDNFLDADYCRDLISSFPAFDPQRALNEYGEVGRKAVVQQLAEIGPSYALFDRLLSSREFLSLVGSITGIANLLYDPDYVGGGTHENLSGQGLDAHVDFNYHPKTRAHRRLNLLLYLNPEWKPEWGGELQLHSNPWLPPHEDRVTTVLPIANRCVLFETSERSWHGFRNIVVPNGGISRRSIAVYFYTADRPAAEVAPQHATVYVHPPLPAHLDVGYSLQEDDVETIRDLLDRRDRHMHFLYDREKAFSATIDGLSATLERTEQSPTFRFARLMTWPLRRLRDLLR